METTTRKDFERKTRMEGRTMGVKESRKSTNGCRGITKIRRVASIVTLAIVFCFNMPSLAQAQLKRMGATMDTSKRIATQDPDHIPRIEADVSMVTFEKLPDGRFKVDQTNSTTFPIVIYESGSYVLTSNIEVSTNNANGIYIMTDDVTFDLNGFAIIGPGKESGGYPESNGIACGYERGEPEPSDITIINGTVRDFPGNGIQIRGYNNQVKDIRVYGNGVSGIDAWGSIIANCTASNNGGNGITVNSSIVTNCIADSNGGNGIYATHSRIDGNYLRCNTEKGLLLDGFNYAIKNVGDRNSIDPVHGLYPMNPAGDFCAYGRNYMPTAGDNANWSAGSLSYEIR